MMRIEAIKKINSFKREFAVRFQELRNLSPVFDNFLHDVLLKGNAYVIGGFIRDIQIQKKSRDIDLIISMKDIKLEDIVKHNFKDQYLKNRMGGYKVALQNFDVDFWSIESNWAFKNKLVKNISKDHLEKIAKGCFFNFDSLVMNVSTLELNTKYFNDCIETNQLDILMKRREYQKLNPTREANILRAFYLRNSYGLDFSDVLIQYLKKQIGYIENQGKNPVEKLLLTQEKYKKYDHHLTKNKIENDIQFVKNYDLKFTGKIRENDPNQLSIV